MTTPRQFFEQFVIRSYREFRAKPDDEYLAKMAVANANDMAVRMLHHYAGTERVYGLTAHRQESLYRDRLAKDHDAFGVVRDVAEGHKHFRVTRGLNTRRVSSASQTGVRPILVMNEAGEELHFVNKAGGRLTFTTDVMVDLNDGTTLPLLPLLEKVVEMWDRLAD